MIIEQHEKHIQLSKNGGQRTLLVLCECLLKALKILNFRDSTKTEMA